MSSPISTTNSDWVLLEESNDTTNSVIDQPSDDSYSVVRTPSGVLRFTINTPTERPRIVSIARRTTQSEPEDWTTLMRRWQAEEQPAHPPCEPERQPVSPTFPCHPAMGAEFIGRARSTELDSKNIEVPERQPTTPMAGSIFFGRVQSTPLATSSVRMPVRQPTSPKGSFSFGRARSTELNSKKIEVPERQPTSPGSAGFAPRTPVGGTELAAVQPKESQNSIPLEPARNARSAPLGYYLQKSLGFMKFDKPDPSRAAETKHGVVHRYHKYEEETYRPNYVAPGPPAPTTPVPVPAPATQPEPVQPEPVQPESSTDVAQHRQEVTFSFGNQPWEQGLKQDEREALHERMEKARYERRMRIIPNFHEKKQAGKEKQQQQNNTATIWPATEFSSIWTPNSSERASFAKKQSQNTPSTPSTPKEPEESEERPRKWYRDLDTDDMSFPTVTCESNELNWNAAVESSSSNETALTFQHVSDHDVVDGKEAFVNAWVEAQVGIGSRAEEIEEEA